MRTIASLALALLAATAAAADVKTKLVGQWATELAGSPLTLELRSDGTATFLGTTSRWQVAGDTLVVGTSTARYQLTGGTLVLTDQDGIVTVWQRVGGATAAKGARSAGQGGARGAAGAKPAGGKGSPVDAQLRQLLLSSAWCSFRYNQHTGTTNQSRVVFAPDGSLQLGTDDQTYNSGWAGTVAGQYRSGSALRWAVQDGRLLVDSGEGQGPQDVGLQVNRNSAGYPILVAGGKEYAACR